MSATKSFLTTNRFIIIIIAFGPYWNTGHLQELSRHPDPELASPPKSEMSFKFLVGVSVTHKVLHKWVVNPLQYLQPGGSRSLAWPLPHRLVKLGCTCQQYKTPTDTVQGSLRHARHPITSSYMHQMMDKAISGQENSVTGRQTGKQAVKDTDTQTDSEICSLGDHKMIKEKTCTA